MRTGRAFRKWWWLALPLGVFLAWYSGVLFDRIVKERLEVLGNRIAGEGYTFTIDDVEPSFLGGGIILRGITLVHDPALMDSLRSGEFGEVLEFTAGRLEVRGISYWGLITRDEIRTRTVVVDRPEIKYTFRPGEDDVADDVVKEEEVADLPSLIRLDTLLIISALGTTTDITGQRPAFQIGSTDIQAYHMRLRSHPDGRMTFTVRGADIHAKELSAELPPIYDLSVDDLRVEHPSGRATIRDIALRSRYDEKEYHKHLEHETDLFNITVDSVAFHRIDVGRFLSEQVLHMTRLEVHAPRAVIHRDKSMPDPPFIHKSLPVSGLRNIGVSIRVDTVQLMDGVVEYHERMERDSEYGMVSFTHINGEMTGVNNSKAAAEGDGELAAKATARVYENTRIQLSYNAPLASSHDQFYLSAELDVLPFTVFNRMTDDLLNVKATAGKIHKMRMRMQGNEWQASGTVDLHYEDLHIDLAPHSTRWHEGLLKNVVGNALVRKHNLPDRKNYRQGEFVVNRRQDRAVFNFLWQAVKAGSIDSMAPGLIRKQMQKAAAPKTEPTASVTKKKKERKKRKRGER